MGFELGQSGSRVCALNHVQAVLQSTHVSCCPSVGYSIGVPLQPWSPAWLSGPLGTTACLCLASVWWRLLHWRWSHVARGALAFPAAGVEPRAAPARTWHACSSTQEKRLSTCQVHSGCTLCRHQPQCRELWKRHKAAWGTLSAPPPRSSTPTRGAGTEGDAGQPGGPWGGGAAPQ